MPLEGRNPVYYVDNFERILDTVTARYADLLTADELAFPSDLRALDLPARCLYVRLLSRVGPCFRRDALRYDEVPDLEAAIEQLAARGLLDPAPGTTPADLLPHLLRCEIEAIGAELGVAAPRGTKSRWIAALLAAGEAPGCSKESSDSPAPSPSPSTPESHRTDTAADRLCEAIRRRVPLVAPLRLRHVTLYRLLFFGNLRQDWTALVLADLGVWRYESYSLRRDLRLFPSRVAIEDALAIRAAADAARSRLAATDLAGAWQVAAQVARRDPPWDPSARAHADAILLEVARALERAGAGAHERARTLAREGGGAAEVVAAQTLAGEGGGAGEFFAQALELYGAASAPPARERRARLLERTGRERGAIALCREIAAAPRDESERLFAARFEQHLRRRIGQVPPVRRRYRTARRLALRPDPARAVEDLALEHFAIAGHPGFHAENWLWLALYGLACWDLVFAPVAGAFEHAFQDGPLDLDQPSFRARRESAIAARLAEIEAGDWPAPRLLAVWEAKQGIRNRLVPWWHDAPRHLELALSRLRGPHVAAVLDRLSRDLGRYGRGLPDLFVAATGDPGFELLEVKGPGDRLRPEQIGWLDYLSQRGLPSSVLQVEWSASSGTRFAAVESPE